MKKHEEVEEQERGDEKLEKLEKLREAFTDVANESMEDALCFSVAMVVGICELAAKNNGEDPNLTMTIPGDASQREITIHPLEETE